MFADVPGFTAQAQANEAAALGRLWEQESLVRPLFASHGGRQVKSTGDGFLAVFESALKATECAVEIQRVLHERSTRSREVSLNLRIGLHVGDVEERDGDIFGDAVNIASRIEPEADAGGICVSGQVFDQIRNKLGNPLIKVGSRKLKNVQEPVDVYKVILPWTAAELSPKDPGPPRLAVLPLANISPDPKDEYFADGLTEELITVLSQLGELRVIARTSIVPYKTVPKPVSQVGTELGVGFVLEGSVRKSGDQLRITAQLIDVASQEHIWATTYDRKLVDVFALQSEVAQQIAAALKIRIAIDERTRIEDRPVVNSGSYLAYLKGRTLLMLDDESGAIRQFEQAVSLDPKNARAYSGLADVASRRLRYSDLQHPRASVDAQRRAYVARAVELEPNLAEARTSLGQVYQHDFDYRAAELEYRLALSLNPSYAPAHLAYAGLFLDRGEPTEALTEFQLAGEADPQSPYIAYLHALILGWVGRFDEMRTMLGRVRTLDPTGSWYFAGLTWYHHNRREYDLAEQAADRLEEVEPGGSWVQHACLTAVAGDSTARAELRVELAKREEEPSSWAVAACYALLGDLDSCFRVMDVSVNNHCLLASFFRLAPHMQVVRDDPRFAPLLQRMHLA